jgi:DNA repair exonuclease SbcCD ATPase subunit
MFDVKSVELVNFRTFRGTHRVQFPTRPGIYLLTGRNDAEPRLGSNGVGKSTLLDAIHWCLYGNTPRGLRAGDVVNWNETSCQVSLGLVIGNQVSLLKRTQSPNSLTSNGHPVSQDDLQKWLRIGPDAFLHSVMLPQFGDSFFDLKPADKLTLFTQIMDLDYWLGKSEEARGLTTEIEAEMVTCRQEASKYEGQIEAITADLPQLMLRERTYDSTQKGIVATLKKDLAELAALQHSTIENLKFVAAALENASNKLAKIEKGTQVCPTCQQTIERPQASKDRAALLKNQADFARQQISLKSDFAVNKSKLGQLEKSIQAELQRSSPYAEQISQKQASLKERKGQLGSVKNHLNECEQEHAAVSYWVNGFKRVRLFVVGEVLRQLEVEVNNNMSSLGLTDWRVEFDVERENKSGGVTKGFTVFVYAPGRAEPVRFEAWSGGETQRLRLAGDLGLANLIMTKAGLTNSIEFFDEPSSHLSEEGINDLLDTLRQRAVSTERRIWVVEHHSLDYGEFAGVLTAVKAGEGSTLMWG